MALSPPVAGSAPRPSRRAPSRTTPAGLADALENPRDDFDRLIGDLRLATRFETSDFDRAEERAQRIVAAILAPFRGERPATAAPLSFTTDGLRSSALF